MCRFQVSCICIQTFWLRTQRLNYFNISGASDQQPFWQFFLFGRACNLWMVAPSVLQRWPFRRFWSHFGISLVFGLASNFYSIGWLRLPHYFLVFFKNFGRVAVGHLTAKFTHGFWMEISLRYSVGATTWFFISFT